MAEAGNAHLVSVPLAEPIANMHISCMESMLYRIRREVFRENQIRFAEIVGVSQATVSRWEKGEQEPTRDKLALIREEARKRRIFWSDAWFFEPVA